MYLLFRHTLLFIQLQVLTTLKHSRLLCFATPITLHRKVLSNQAIFVNDSNIRANNVV